MGTRVRKHFSHVFSFLFLLGTSNLLFKLGMAELKKQITNFRNALKTYMKAIPSRDPGTFRESLSNLKGAIMPTLIASLGIGFIGSYIVPSNTDLNVPKIAVKYFPARDEILLNLLDRNGVETRASIEGMNESIGQAVSQALAERAPLFRIGPFLSPESEHWRNGNYVASFPVTFHAATLGLGSDHPHDGERHSEVPFTSGAEYDPDLNGNLLRLLVEALAPCGEEDGTNPVWLQIKGYASSAQFSYEGSGDVMAESDDLNITLANERRRSVEQKLREAIMRMGVENRIRLVGTTDYDRLSQLARDLKFNDRPDSGTSENSPPQDRITRSAIVNVLSAARCAEDYARLYPSVL